jgi:hypothetical protein
MKFILYSKLDKTLKYINKQDVHKFLYYLKARLPTEQDIKSYIKKGTNKKIISYFKDKDINKRINKIKKSISKIDLYIPLYDEYSKNLYIITRENVYDRVVYQHYRFPDVNMVKYLTKKRNKLKTKLKDIIDTKQSLGDYDKTSKIHYKKKQSDAFLKREYRKLNLMIDFLSSFDLEQLEMTYIYTFYHYSNKVGKEITICRRPSFLPHFKHIRPYYRRSELINMGLNMELIKPDKKYYDRESILKLCDKIMENDISAKTIMEHQIYILKNKMEGIVLYYSLQGSYFMNQYLRGLISYQYRNQLLEDNIKSIWRLINNAPPFKSNYILYRFIKSDPHLKHLEIGDTYTSPSFISTTRDPFYRSEIYRFGFILIKIKIPKDKRGIALCMETCSHFPEEQEIILSPLTMLRLDKKDDNAPYFHTDDNYQALIKTRYEFTYIGNKPITFKTRKLYENFQVIDFLKINRTESLTIDEKISYFISNYVTPFNQFQCKIGEKVYTIITEFYDSTEVYRKFYQHRTNNGFSMYTITNNKFTFMLELGEDEQGSFLYVNYYFRFSSVDESSIINDMDLVKFISSVGYYFNVRSIVLYSYYSSYYSCTSDTQHNIQYDRIYHGGNYCMDYYNYIKYGKKRFDKINEINPKFSYYHLDRLKKYSPTKILTKDDKDEVYQIYDNVVSKDRYNYNIADFYIWMIENNCIFVNALVKKFSRLYQDKFNNPFRNDYYLIDGASFLYNRKYIDEFPIMSGREDDVDNKNIYRLVRTTEMRNRIPPSRTVDG